MEIIKESKGVINALPPHGWVTELSRLTGYNRLTVSRAIRNNQRGVKADKVRQLYRSKYQTNNNQ